MAYSLGWTGRQLDGLTCKGKGQGHGPYDYIEVMTTNNNYLKEAARLWEVNKIHYGKAERILKKEGITFKNISQIIREYDYTLRAFPNHTRALYSLVKFELKRRSMNNKREFSLYHTDYPPPECYFQRAIKYRPKQSSLYALYGLYLHRIKEYKKAKIEYQKALKLNPDYTEVHYNLGLLLVQLKEYDEALKHAKKAYAKKYPLQGLKSKLKKAGVWK